MATKRASSSQAGVLETQAAAELILQREEMRQQKARRRVKRRRREQLQEERKSVQKMHDSIEVIKWCIVAICTVWLISFVISIVVLVRVQSKVVEIETQVKRIQHVMDNPFSSAGARLGAQADEKLKELLGLPDLQEDEQ